MCDTFKKIKNKQTNKHNKYSVEQHKNNIKNFCYVTNSKIKQNSTPLAVFSLFFLKIFNSVEMKIYKYSSRRFLFDSFSWQTEH
jgi:hypothetical protein